MAEVAITPAAVSEYKNDKLQNAVETARLGYQGGDYPGYHDIVIELELPRGLKSLTVYQDWSSRNPANVYPTYGVWLTREVLTAPPDTDAELTFKFSSGNEATVTVERKLAKGKWYLWFGRIRGTGEAAGFLSGDRDKCPALSITGEAVGAGHVYRNGVWQETAPKVYRDGTWQEAAAREYKEAWEELA